MVMWRCSWIVLCVLFVTPSSRAEVCPPPVEEVVCLLDRVGALCTGLAPVALMESGSSGAVYRIDMADWQVVALETVALQPTGYALHVANAPTSDGWGGDAGESRFDAEFHLFNRGAYLYANDALPAQRLASSPLPRGAARLSVRICGGGFAFETPVDGFDAWGESVFQIAGERADAESGAFNDTLLWLGIGRTVGDPGRTGSGVGVVRVTFGR